jgi:hypothetical protein
MRAQRSNANIGKRVMIRTISFEARRLFALEDTPDTP